MTLENGVTSNVLCNNNNNSNSNDNIDSNNSGENARKWG